MTSPSGWGLPDGRRPTGIARTPDARRDDPRPTTRTSTMLASLTPSVVRSRPTDRPDLHHRAEEGDRGQRDSGGVNRWHPANVSVLDDVHPERPGAAPEPATTAAGVQPPPW